MALLKTSYISKTTLSLVAALLSISVMALDFNQTQRLANQGDTSAQYNLGIMYYKGDGILQDHTKATEWFQKASNQGHTNAQFNLEAMHTNEDNKRQNYDKVIEWYGKQNSQKFIEYSIPEMGAISIPTNMELQQGKYKDLNVSTRQVISNQTGLDLQLKPKTKIFQQLGLNKFVQPSFSTYVRIIIETESGNNGDYEKLDDPYLLSSSQLSQLNTAIYNETRTLLPKTNNKLLRWYGVHPVSINKYNALEISYLRQLNDNPHVVVKIYYFQNSDRSHMIKVSYRQIDEELWKPLLEKALDSITINRR